MRFIQVRSSKSKFFRTIASGLRERVALATLTAESQMSSESDGTRKQSTRNTHLHFFFLSPLPGLEEDFLWVPGTYLFYVLLRILYVTGHSGGHFLVPRGERKFRISTVSDS